MKFFNFIAVLRTSNTLYKMFKQISWKELLLIFTFLIYSILILWVGIFHFEPWRDQAHVWVSTRDGSWWDVFTTIPAHSHPFLWFFLIKILVVLGLPYQASVVLNLVCCIALVGVLAYKAPLPWWLKIAFSFSFPILYEFAFPGRIYALGILLSFLICSVFPVRHRRPILFCSLIALTFHTHFLFLAFSAPVMMMFVFESWLNKKIFTKPYIIGYIIVLLSGFYFLWYVREVGQYSELLNLQKIKVTLLNIFDLSLTVEKNTYSLLTASTVLFFLAAQLRRIKPFLISIFAMVFMVYCYQNILPDFIRYYQVLPAVMICLMWIYEYYAPQLSPANSLILKTKEPKHKPKGPTKAWSWWPFLQTGFYILFGLCTLISCKAGIKHLISEISEPHSDARNVAKFLQKNNLLDHTLVGHRSYTASAVVPYLPPTKSIWYADRQEFGTYLKFDSLFYQKNITVTYPQAVSNALSQFGNEKNLLFIASIPLKNEYSVQWNLIYQSNKKTIQTDEVYFIYQRR